MLGRRDGPPGSGGPGPVRHRPPPRRRRPVVVSVRFDCDEPDQRRDGITQAVAAIRRGQLVVLPTDTVYGVGADAFTPAAVDALLFANGRGRGGPVAVYLDGGRCADPVPSTIVDLTGAAPRLLRPGAVEVELLRGVLPDLEDAR